MPQMSSLILEMKANSKCRAILYFGKFLAFMHATL